MKDRKSGIRLCLDISSHDPFIGLSSHLAKNPDECPFRHASGLLFELASALTSESEPDERRLRSLRIESSVALEAAIALMPDSDLPSLYAPIAARVSRGSSPTREILGAATWLVMLADAVEVVAWESGRIDVAA